ncbi:hypothetical protein FRC11_004891 [Ceratobasidium sp. 423]|nr:hypothetical protein FRC11_004891 [Ceratobasidium sp. 423]
MPRPKKSTQAKRKNAATGTAAFLSKRRKLESDDLVPASNLPGPPSEDGAKSGDEASLETPTIDESSGYVPPEQSEPRDWLENQRLRGPEDEFSSQNGPEQPDYDEGQPNGEPPDIIHKEDRRSDPLAEEQHAIQG